MKHLELIAELDSTISTYVIARDGGCVTCPALTDLTSSHLIGRSAKSVKYVEANVFCQCANCNRTHNTNQGPLLIIFFSRYNYIQWQQLEAKSKELAHFKEFHYQELLHQWRAKLTEILAEKGLTEEGVNLLKMKSQVRIYDHER